MVMKLVSGTSVRTQSIAVPVYDLGCGGGSALSIEGSLAKCPGVTKIYANPAAEAVYVDYDPTLVSANEVIAAVETLGFRTGQPRVL